MKYLTIALLLLFSQTALIRNLGLVDPLGINQSLLSLQFDFTTILVGGQFSVIWNNGYQVSVVTADLLNLGSFHATTPIVANNGDSTLYISVGSWLTLSNIHLDQHYGCSAQDNPTNITGKSINDLLALPAYNKQNLATSDLNRILTVTITNGCLTSVS